MKKVNNLLTIFRSFYHYKKGSTKLPYNPLAIWIEPTNVCNLKCIMCPNSIIKQKKPGFMKLSLYKKIIDQVKSHVSYVVLCISGESLLHPKLTQMISYAKQNDIATYISTNATVLTPALSKKLLTSGLDYINFSFDGTSKKIYEKVRVGANYDKTLSNIIKFLRLKKKLGSKIHVELQILIMDKEGERDYKKNIKTFKKKFEGLPLDYIQKRLPSTWGKALLNTKKYTPKKLGKIYSPCSYLWSSLHVLWDGRVVACTSDFFGRNVLGKFPEKSLKTIWNDTPMQQLRKAMLNRQYLEINPNCQNCDTLWEPRIFGLPAGMRGVFATTLNSLLGKDLSKFFKKLVKKINPSFAMNIESNK